MIIGIGTDILDCKRLEGVIERRGQKFIDRIFTKQEQVFCNKRQAPVQTYGKTFAAKEAVLKAIGFVEGILWHDIEIIRKDYGKPSIHVSGVAFKNLMTLIPHGFVPKFDISLSDEPPYAVAFVVISAMKESL